MQHNPRNHRDETTNEIDKGAARACHRKVDQNIRHREAQQEVHLSHTKMITAMKKSETEIKGRMGQK